MRPSSPLSRSSLLLAVTSAHLLAFGKNVKEYRNMTASGYALLRSLLGDFDLEQLVGAQWLLGIILFVRGTRVPPCVLDGTTLNALCGRPCSRPFPCWWC